MDAGQTLLDGQRPEEASPLIEELCAEAPDRNDFAQTRARCEIALGLFEEAQRTIDDTVSTFGNKAMSAPLAAQVAFQIGQYDFALEHLEAARETGSQNPQFWQLLGQMLLRQRRWPEAEQGSSASQAQANQTMSYRRLRILATKNIADQSR